MSVDFTYPMIVIIVGIIVTTIILIALLRLSNKIITRFQLYPESKGILPISLKLITIGISGTIFLLFLRFALKTGELTFTADVVTELILASPKYILAAMLIVAGFYISRMIKEKSATYSFAQKNRVLLVMDFIIHMTFFFTALSTIGIDTSFFVLFYIISISTIGFIVAITVGLSIGIPFGVELYKLLKDPKNKKK